MSKLSIDQNLVLMLLLPLTVVTLEICERLRSPEIQPVRCCTVGCSIVAKCATDNHTLLFFRKGGFLHPTDHEAFEMEISKMSLLTWKFLQKWLERNLRRL